MPEKNRNASSDEVSGLSFEQALAELESIVARLESGKVDLEESIGIYERGSLLKAHCEAKLKEAHARIEQIVVSAEGVVSVLPQDIAG